MAAASAPASPLHPAVAQFDRFCASVLDINSVEKEKEYLRTDPILQRLFLDQVVEGSYILPSLHHNLLQGPGGVTRLLDRGAPLLFFRAVSILLRQQDELLPPPPDHTEETRNDLNRQLGRFERFKEVTSGLTKAVTFIVIVQSRNMAYMLSCEDGDEFRLKLKLTQFFFGTKGRLPSLLREEYPHGKEIATTYGTKTRRAYQDARDFLRIVALVDASYIEVIPLIPVLTELVLSYWVGGLLLSPLSNNER